MPATCLGAMTYADDCKLGRNFRGCLSWDFICGVCPQVIEFADKGMPSSRRMSPIYSNVMILSARYNGETTSMESELACAR